MIIEMTPSFVRLLVGWRTVTVAWEGHFGLRKPGLPDFVIYASSIAQWDFPFRRQISAKGKQKILRTLERNLQRKGLTYEIHEA